MSLVFFTERTGFKMKNRKKIKKVMVADFDKDANYNKIINRIEKHQKNYRQFRYVFVSVLVGLFFLSVLSVNNIFCANETCSTYNRTLTDETNSPSSSSKPPNSDGIDDKEFGNPSSSLSLYYHDNIVIYAQGLDKINITIDNKSFDLKEYLKNSKKSTSKALDDIIKKLKKDNNYNILNFEVYHDEKDLTIIKCKKANKVYVGNNKMIINENICN